MTENMAGIFTSGIELAVGQRLWLMLPLCLSVAVVYKATRVERMRDLPIAALGLWVTIVLGMGLVGVGLWAVFSLLV